ncbi:hypothetical protein [Enterococcus sp. 5H]|uniref:hypothetical protein n=1 Tax=Enterococcus sp. 5H TaxID=1229490 RepID=UPI002303E3CD|nr:hypothetical protein [Enterococcus sp. 5H]MDA9469897.1 hypothetical protein [Enterococcus sp. 5H]
MNVSFAFLTIEHMDVPLDRKIPLAKAVLLIEKQNLIAKESNISMQFSYGLYEDENEVYQSSLQLPKEKVDLFLAIVAEVKESAFEDEKQREAILNWLCLAFNRKRTKEERPHKEKKPKKVKEPKKHRSFSFPKVSKKVILIVVSLLIFSGVCVGGLYFAINQHDKQPPLEVLLKEGAFLEAGKQYPEEHQRIEQELFTLTRTKDRSYLDKLRVFHREYPTIQGDFDLSIFDFNYEEAITIFKQERDLFLADNERLPLVGYAFLKIDEVDEAKQIQEKSGNAELQKLILQYEQALLIIDEKEKEIQELQKKPTENKEKIEQAINDLYEAKETLSQF